MADQSKKNVYEKKQKTQAVRRRKSRDMEQKTKTQAKPKKSAEKPKRAAAMVLILDFVFHDIEELEAEAVAVQDAFGAKHYDVERFPIPMENPGTAVQQELERLMATLDEGMMLIVYYHGHGGLDENGSLFLTSHNYPSNILQVHIDACNFWARLGDMSLEDQNQLKEENKIYQPIAEIAWNTIWRQIMEMKRDAVAILDCCFSGAAAVGEDVLEQAARAGPDFNTALDRLLQETAVQEGVIYVKEVIAATSWATKTQDKMSKVLCRVLEASKGKDISVETLYERMNDILSCESKAPQPVRRRFNVSGRKARLPFTQAEEED